VSSNTLVAFCVGCLFLLAVLVVLLSFADRRARRTRTAVAMLPTSEKPTQPHGWPEQKEPDLP
jgi:hypothetical protein